MKAKVRGRTGSVHGMSAKKVREYVEKTVRHLRRERADFSRVEVQVYLVSQGLSWKKAEGIVNAIVKHPGIAQRTGARGLYELLPGAEQVARHRDWKFNVGKLGLATTKELITIMERATAGDMSPELRSIYERGRKALRHINV
jgi:hypothetical protein